MKWSEYLAAMTGRLALISDGEADLLAEIVRFCPGNHVEIGCLWGGTAIIAAQSKQAGLTITIDPMTGGWWDSADPSNDLRPTALAVLGNFRRFGVAHKIAIVNAPSDPWPLPDEVAPDTILIDGDHAYAGARADWLNARNRARRYILVHDYGSDRHPGVQRMVDNIAMTDPYWLELCRADTLIVFERVGGE